MINDEALVQTKSLLTQLSLTTNQRNPGCLCDRGQHGQRGLQHKLHGLVGQQGEDGDRRGGRLRRNKVEEFDGDHAVERRHGDGYLRLLLPHQRALGSAQGLQARLDKVEAWQAQRGPIAAEPLKDRHHRGGHKEGVPSPGVPANVYSDDGSEFKREFKKLMDFWDIEKQVTRGHAYFAERIIRTIKKAMLRRIVAGAGRGGSGTLCWPTS